MEGKTKTMQSHGLVIKVSLCKRAQGFCAFLPPIKHSHSQKKKNQPPKMTLFQGEKINLDIIIW